MDERPLIPESLYSAFAEGPFTTCSACGADVSSPGAFHQIQKTWRNREVVFELALCANCARNVARSFSRESAERIQKFFSEHYRPSHDTETCHFCRRILGPDEDREMAGVVEGSHLMNPVVVMCMDCAEETREQLSEQTKGSWGDFLDRTLPGVPREMEPDTFPIGL